MRAFRKNDPKDVFVSRCRSWRHSAMFEEFFLWFFARISSCTSCSFPDDLRAQTTQKWENVCSCTWSRCGMSWIYWDYKRLWGRRRWRRTFDSAVGRQAAEATNLLVWRSRMGRLKHLWFFNISNSQQTRREWRWEKSCWEIYGFHVRDKKPAPTRISEKHFKRRLPFEHNFLRPDSCDRSEKERSAHIVAQWIGNLRRKGKNIQISLLFRRAESDEVSHRHITCDRCPHTFLIPISLSACGLWTIHLRVSLVSIVRSSFGSSAPACLFS